MTHRCLSFPFAQSLLDADSWEKLAGKRGPYRVLRFHFVADEHVVPGPPRMGERLSVHYAQDAEAVELVHSIEVELATLNFEESLRESVLTREVIEDISDCLNASVSGPGKLASISAESRVAIRERLTRSTKTSSRLQQSVTERKRFKFDVKYLLSASSKVSQVNVAMYEEHAVDVYLVWLDYLDVEYGKSMIGLRKKRVKSPAFDVGRRARSNELELQLPIGSFRYWKPLPHSSWMVRESDYQSQVEDSTEIDQLPIANPKLHERKNFARVPSLYQLSNVAFPLKWIDRKGEWTREQLMAIEHDEARNSIWWFQNGPGRLQKL